ncbi:MAG: glycosyltransferase family 4 protein [Verrucomicrobiales bacterium]|nr:glycosyltransferase family 4 protein [Verrucomicrobiales bacterium]
MSGVYSPRLPPPEPLRIAILCPSHSLGDERVVARQALSLARMGHTVTVLGRGDPDKKLPVHPRLQLESLLPMLRTASAASRLVRLKALLKARRLVLACRPHVLAAHEPDSAWLALSLRRRTGAAIHFDIHECFEEMAAARAPRAVAGWVRRFVWWGVSAAARRCDWLTVVSPHTARQYRAVHPKGRVAVLHNSPPIETFPLASQRVTGPITLCHEGWLDRSRGMTQILRALVLARRTADVRLLVVGKLRPGCEAEFHALVRELGLDQVVTVTGWLPYDEVGRVDATAQIGLVTMQPSGNNFGSLSNKLYSYMACGHAIIVPAGSATAEVAEQHQCGVAVDTTDPQAIADAICRLANDAALREELGARGRRAVVEELGWHRMEEVLRRIYQELGEKSLGAGAAPAKPGPSGGG